MKSHLRSNSGQTAIEYALMGIVLIAIVASSASLIQQSLNSPYGTLKSKLTNELQTLDAPVGGVGAITQG
jgi:Flp pilus assembly pilin Flp